MTGGEPHNGRWQMLTDRLDRHAHQLDGHDHRLRDVESVLNQLRGAKALLGVIFGTSLLGLAVALVTLVIVVTGAP